MHKHDNIVIRINGEPVTLRKFEKFAIHTLTLSVARGEIEDGGVDTNSSEEIAIIEFINNISDVLEDKPNFNLCEDTFWKLIASTVLVMGFATDLIDKIDAHKLARFTNLWHDLLYTDWYGKSFVDTNNKLCEVLYGPYNRHEI